MSFSISPAKNEDIESLVELEKFVFRTSDGILSQRAFRYHIQRQKNLLLVAKTAEPRSQLVAYILVFLHKHSARIYSLAVSPKYQNCGIGSTLLKNSIEEIKKKGIRKISLELRGDNTSALKLYKSLGFKISGRRSDYYQPGEDAIVMTWLQNG